MREKYGFNDSKQVKEEDRERMLSEMQKIEFSELGFFSDVIMPDYLSSMMLNTSTEGRNLNEISHTSAINLIKKVKELGVNVTHVYLDTVGPPEKYRDLIKSRLQDPKIEVTVESKADSKFPVVSAASIVAKVTRD